MIIHCDKGVPQVFVKRCVSMDGTALAIQNWYNEKFSKFGCINVISTSINFIVGKWYEIIIVYQEF